MGIYVNGEICGTLPKSGAIARYPTDVHIGAGIYGNAQTEYLNGTIDEVCIYNQALSAEEIMAQYQEGDGTIAPIVTNLRNDTLTSHSVNLIWNCSADIDHYTLYQDGALLANTVNEYCNVTGLSPATTYTFSVSATTTAGITGENATLTLRTLIGASPDDTNTLHIPGDIIASCGNSVTVPIMILNATGVAGVGMKLTFDSDVVNVTAAAEGDFTGYFGFNGRGTADGGVTINTFATATDPTCDLTVAYVTLVAVGKAGAVSPLNLEILAMADQNGDTVSGTASNGSFTISVDTSPPIVTNPSASHLIPDDTDGVPLWGETAVLNVTVTDWSGVASVTIDLSTIGGSPAQLMTHIGDNIWSTTTNASAGTPPQTYDLMVSETDILGYINTTECVQLIVMQNGDTNGNGLVDVSDVMLLANYASYPGQYAISSEFVADVTGDGAVSIMDALLLINHVVNPDRYILR